MKRKAPDSPVVPKAVSGNIQRKRAANGQAKRAIDDDDESDDYKEEGIIKRIQAQRRGAAVQRKRIVDSDSDLDEDDDSEFDEFGGDDDSI